MVGFHDAFDTAVARWLSRIRLPFRARHANRLISRSEDDYITIILAPRIGRSGCAWRDRRSIIRTGSGQSIVHCQVLSRWCGM